MTIWLWVGFLTLVIALLALDLGVFNRKAHSIGIAEASAWTVFWIVLSLLFNVGVYFLYEHHSFGAGYFGGHTMDGSTAAIQFLTAYVIEKSLSLDNIFVFALIFSYFQVPMKYQHRVLYWGILGALIMRGIMIGAGAILIQRFSWVEYVFGAFLVFTAIKLLFDHHTEIDPEKNYFIRLTRRFFPVSPQMEGEHFFTHINGKLALTPLLLVLVLVESSDVIFAVDSIPAVFAVTKDPFLVFTSNVFAILGLRSLYFVLAAVIHRFRFLKLCLVVILAFVGVKMLVAHYFAISSLTSLGIITGILTAGILASIFMPQKKKIPMNP